MHEISKVRILIVDDKPDKAKAFESIVSELGEVVTVNSGKDALRCLVDQNFAVILLDVNMPIMDGFETAELIRQRETLARTPIIFVSSYYDADTHKARAYTLGAVDYILAPVIPEVLKAKISVFVELFKKTEEVKLRANERVQLMQEQMARVTAELARSAAEESERRSTFIAEASRLLGSSLESETIMERFAQWMISEVCDCCAVVIFKGEEESQLAVAHRNAEAVSSIRDVLKTFLESFASLMQTRLSERPGFIGEITDPLLEQAAVTEAHAQAIRSLGLKYYIAVPFSIHNRTLGALILVTEETRALRQKDLIMAQDLGRRGAIAIENARLYKEAQEANRLKDDFLAIVSHELRTPLTPILGWTRMLRAQTYDAEEFKRGLEIIERNARSQAKLIEELLDVSRIIAGKLCLTLSDVNMDVLARNSIDGLKPAADAKRIRIHYTSGAQPAILQADPERIQQVLWNLLSNAIKFTPNEGEVRIQTSVDAGNVIIEVADNGKGIDAKFLPFVFERFRQADSSTTRIYGGLGIGLAIVRHLVELHGGVVQVVSPGEGLGTTFTVTLPIPDSRLASVKAKDESSISVRKKPTMAHSLDGVQILLVDDEPDCREMLSTIFKRCGAIVTEAASANEALECLSECNANLIVSDIGMAENDGFYLIRNIRGNAGSFSKIPAIALTAYAREEDKASAIAAGFHVHVSKPIDPVILLNSVTELLRNQKSDVGTVPAS